MIENILFMFVLLAIASLCEFLLAIFKIKEAPITVNYVLFWFTWLGAFTIEAVCISASRAVGTSSVSPKGLCYLLIVSGGLHFAWSLFAFSLGQIISVKKEEKSNE